MRINPKRATAALLAGALVLAPAAGCENLPGSKGTQGAVIGGAGGAAIGAAVAKNNRLLGALIGGLLGAGGGYLVGANVDKIRGKDTEGAQKAVQRAQTQPATAADVSRATTADLNNDGFVTLDEVTAMKKANLSDDEMIRRLEATGQVFELSPDQERQLRDQGISNRVITAMRTINQEQKQQLLNTDSTAADNAVLGHTR